jgi:hypothetical protein
VERDRVVSAGEMFKLRRPCVKCPFRSDVPGYLRKGRAVEIARSIAEGAIFVCHETTVADPDDDSALMGGPSSQFCAGALIVMEKNEAPNQAVRMAGRTGLYDPERMDMGAPVVGSLVEFVDHHGHTALDALIAEAKAEEDGELAMESTCEVVEAGCLAPAGYMIGGLVVPGDNDDEVELHLCPECGRTVCDNCSGEEGRCAYCAS